jgi:hypothetical protein
LVFFSAGVEKTRQNQLKNQLDPQTNGTARQQRVVVRSVVHGLNFKVCD